MQTPFSAYNEVAPQVYRETSGLYYEDFVVGDTFEHRPGRTITDTDNIWMTLLTMNTQPVHFDAKYAATTEWKRLLVDSTLTLAMLTGMSVRTVSAKVVANLGWDKVRATTSGVRRRHALCSVHRAVQAGVENPAHPRHRHCANHRNQPRRCRGDDL